MPKQRRNLCRLLRERETPYHHAARPEQHDVQQRLEEVIDAAIQYADTCSFFLEDKCVPQDVLDPLSDFNKLVAKIKKWVAKVHNMAMFNAQSGFILDTIDDRVILYQILEKRVASSERSTTTKEVLSFCKYVSGQLLRWVVSVDPAKGALFGELPDISGTGNPYCVHMNLIH